MRRLLLLLLSLSLSLSYETSSSSAAAAASSGSCSDRRCGSTSVPYPFGFSGDCPILLDCNASASTPLLPHSPAPASPYTILSFNAAASTFLVSLPPSCSRTVSEARAALNGSVYGVTNHTGLFLSGGCHSHRAAGANCSVSADIMTTLLRTAGCGGNDTAWTCVAEAELPAANSSSAANAPAARGQQSHRFLEWKRVDDAGCEHALTATVYGEATEGVPALEFSVVELGWWLNGKCAAAAGNCAQNATCHDVETPSGSWGHLCRCPDGMSGDGYPAGDGCYYVAGECLCFP